MHLHEEQNYSSLLQKSPIKETIFCTCAHLSAFAFERQRARVGKGVLSLAQSDEEQGPLMSYDQDQGCVDKSKGVLIKSKGVLINSLPGCVGDKECGCGDMGWQRVVGSFKL